jgi:hypothetical protein
MTKYDELNTAQSCVYLGSQLPTTPAAYYGVDSRDGVGWKGGEMAFLNGSASISGRYKLFIQVASSGVTATWARRQDVFVAA